MDSDGDQVQHRWVRDAILNSWQAHLDVNFNCWGRCDINTTNTLHIKDSYDKNEKVRSLIGTNARDKVFGMHLGKTTWRGSPLTFGVIEPVILLPDFIEEGTRESLSFMLAHELAHVQRREVFTVRIAYAVCCLFWIALIAPVAPSTRRRTKKVPDTVASPSAKNRCQTGADISRYIDSAYCRSWWEACCRLTDVMRALVQIRRVLLSRRKVHLHGVRCGPGGIAMPSHATWPRARISANIG